MFILALRNFKNPGYIYLLILTILLRIVPIILLSSKQEVVIFEPYIRSLLPISFSFLSTPWINLIITGLLVYIQAILFNQILINYNIFSKPSFIPAAVYIVVSSLFTIFLTLQPVLIANFLMLWLMERLFSIYKTDKPIARAFDLGLIVAAGTFVYFPFFVMLPIIWIGLTLYLPFSWRFWLSGLLGFLVPYFFFWVYFFISDNQPGFIAIFKPLHFNNPTYLPIVGKELWTLVPVIAILLMSVYFYQLNAARNLILVRKSLRLLVFLIVLSGLGYYLQPLAMQNLGLNFSLKTHHTLLHFLIWAAPISVYLSYYFIFARRQWIYETVFLCLVGTIVYFQFLTGFGH
jgi:hypothetical protein